MQSWLTQQRSLQVYQRCWSLPCARDLEGHAQCQAGGQVGNPRNSDPFVANVHPSVANEKDWDALRIICYGL
jgi:hypothetical protein